MRDFDPYIDAQASERSAQVIQIDNGKTANVVFMAALICGICMAVTIGTVWHAKRYEVETQARIRVLQNHVDELVAQVRVSNELEIANASKR